MLKKGLLANIGLIDCSPTPTAGATAGDTAGDAAAGDGATVGATGSFTLASCSSRVGRVTGSAVTGTGATGAGATGTGATGAGATTAGSTVAACASGIVTFWATSLSLANFFSFSNIVDFCFSTSALKPGLPLIDSIEGPPPPGTSLKPPAPTDRLSSRSLWLIPLLTSTAFSASWLILSSVISLGLFSTKSKSLSKLRSLPSIRSLRLSWISLMRLSSSFVLTPSLLILIIVSWFILASSLSFNWLDLSS